MKRSKTTCSILIFAVWIGVSGFERLAAQDGERQDRRRGRPSEMGGPGGQAPWMRGGGPGGPGGPAPWMREGGPGGPGGDRQRPGNNADRNERMLGMLRSMDRNGDGKLDASEIPEYRRNFVSSIVTRMGGDPNKTIDLNDLARRTSSGSTSPSRSGVSSSGGASSPALATDPLVPYFGEKEEARTTILAFGQKEPEPKTAVSLSNNGSASLSQADRILRQARDIMNRFDKNKNGTLDKDKGEWAPELPIKADASDKNRDGRISMSELIDALGGKSGATAGAAAVSTRQSVAYDRLPQGVPNWFFERDKDQDGQLTMAEYAAGKTWTEAIADEFRFLDKNNDGVATVAEVFAVLKQVDEEKRLKEEQAKREQERRRGGAALPTEQAEAGKPGEAPPAPPSNESAPPPVSPSSAVGPSESAPNWRPASAPSSSAPETAPYAGGSSDSERRDGSRRTNSSRRSSRR